MSVMQLKLKFEDGEIVPLSKDEQFALTMRLAGYAGTDQQFSDLACFARTAIRMGIAKDRFATRLVKTIWDGML